MKGNRMKIRSKIPFLSIGFGTVVFLGFAATISGSLAWWAYSTRISVSYQGTSVASAEQLQIGLKSNDSGLAAYGMSNTDTPGYYFSTSGSGLQADVITYYLTHCGTNYATNKLEPVTSGSYTIGDTLSLKNSLVSGNIYNDHAADVNRYVKIPLAFRILKYDNTTEGVNTSIEFIKQIIWVVTSFALMALIIYIDYKYLYDFAYYIYGVCILLLIITLLVGNKVNGARSWLGFPGIGIQPSEFTKLATIIALSAFCTKNRENIRSLVVFLRAALIPALPMALILAQPDLGTALVYIPIFLVILFMAGAKIRYLFFLVACGICVTLFTIFNEVFIAGIMTFCIIDSF